MEIMFCLEGKKKEKYCFFDLFWSWNV